MLIQTIKQEYPKVTAIASWKKSFRTDCTVKYNYLKRAPTPASILKMA
jgi:hypothetical protein